MFNLIGIDALDRVNRAIDPLQSIAAYSACETTLSLRAIVLKRIAKKIRLARIKIRDNATYRSLCFDIQFFLN